MKGGGEKSIVTTTTQRDGAWRTDGHEEQCLPRTRFERGEVQRQLPAVIATACRLDLCKRGLALRVVAAAYHDGRAHFGQLNPGFEGKTSGTGHQRDASAKVRW